MNIKPPGCVLENPVCTWLLSADFNWLKKQALTYNVSVAAYIRIIIVDAHMAANRLPSDIVRPMPVSSSKWFNKPEVVHKITKLLKATDKTSVQIAKEMGVSRHALERFVKKHNLGSLAFRRKRITAPQYAANGHGPRQEAM